MPDPATSQATARSTPRQRLRVSVILAVLVAAAFAFWPRNSGPAFLFEVTMRASLPGFAQLYYDRGFGHNERDSFRLQVEGRNRETRCQFPLAEGAYSKLRFDPTDRAQNSITLSAAQIVDRAGRVVRAISPNQFKAVNQIEGLTTNDREVKFTTAANGNDSILDVELGELVGLKSFGQASWRTLLRRFLIGFVAAAGVLGALAPLLVSRITPALLRSIRRVTAWGSAHPHQVLLIAAAASVLLSCYPIVFFGRSFLSPNNHSHTFLLYGEMPTLPGANQVVTDDEKGSDLGAAMWYSWPTSVAESRALFKDRELPLWNRYDSGGLPLLGQGQSMFGDPLHWLVLLTNGSAGWWDLKYLLAKFLFAAALGFCVLRLTRHLPAAILVSLSAAFIGFFSYRYSHPAFFSLCYAPLIYLGWINLVTAPRGRATAFWLAIMVVANWTVMNSGTVKEAYVLLLAMNFCGCLTLVFTPTDAKVARLGLALLAQLLFLLMAAPVWLTFLHTLRNSWTVYQDGGAFQIQPSLLIGLFDDIFYRQFNAGELHLDPSANFLVLGAVLWLCFSPNRRPAFALASGPGLTALLALAVVFGVIPPAIITRLPFIGQIYHVDNTFSAVAIICLLLLAGFGIKAFWADSRMPAFRQTALRVFAVVAVLLALYLGTTEAVQRSTIALVHGADRIPKSPFFWGYSLSLIVGLAVVIWTGRAVIASRAKALHAVSLAVALVLLHWRHGMHLHTPFDAYVMNPQPRTDLIATSSAALKFLAKTEQEPARVVGLNYDFAPGYGSAVGIEQIDSAAPLLNRYYKSLMDNFGAALLFGSSKTETVDEQLAADLPVFNLVNARYFLGHAESKAATLPALKNIATLDLSVYESRDAWPRAFFTPGYVPYSDEKDFVTLVRNGTGAPFAAIARDDLAQNPKLKDLPEQRQAAAIVPATDYRLTSNTTSFKISAPGPGVAVLSENYVAGDFQLRVNGEPATYFRVNSAFKGVLLPRAGDYVISYSYWPANFTLSLWFAGAGLGAFVLLLIFVAKRS